MALQVCLKCGTAYAPAGACPHCGADSWVDEQEAEQLGVYKQLNAGDEASIAPGNPLGIEVKSGDGTEEGNAPLTDAQLAAQDAEGSGEASEVPATEEPAEPPAEPTVADIRAWAKAQGLDVADSGALPQFVVDEYNKEHGL